MREPKPKHILKGNTYHELLKQLVKIIDEEAAKAKAEKEKDVVKITNN